MSKNNQGPKKLRIIGGQWRSRIIEFACNEAIRPTPDRVRETLFNWLQHHLPAATCLEPYAGSGILSIEALSRGAASVTLLDIHAPSIRQINDNLVRLEAPRDRYTTHCADAINWLETVEDLAWDLILLDPPFTKTAYGSLFQLIDKKRLLRPGGLVYIESAEAILATDLPASWQIHKQKRAGKVHFCLCHEIK